MSTIVLPLSQGREALIDEADLPLVRDYRWYAAWRGLWYAQTNVEGNRTVQMHRLLLDAPLGAEVDHRDGDGLNNRRGNLRLASHAQNQHNQGKYANNTSGYKGVFVPRGRSRRWTAAIRHSGKLIHLGHFLDPIDAAHAYDAAAAKLFGEFARLNFPEGGDTANR